MPDIAAEFTAACGPCAKEFGVPEKIHPEDFMFWAIHDWSGPDKSRVVANYFGSGHTDALIIKGILDQFRVLPRPFSFLEFASGYGRITRHMKRVVPDAQVTASDIHPAAVEFLRSIDIPAVLSSRVPEEFDPGATFDVICAVSFFTHVPRETWGRWLRSICRFLSKGGMLMFTTGGRVTLRIPSITALSIGSEHVPADGFLFLPVSDQRDLSLTDYGTTITLFEFVFKEALEAGLRIVWFQEAVFGTHQDLVVVTQGDSNLESFRNSTIPVRPRLWRRFF